jgi:hypothetical protein
MKYIISMLFSFLVVEYSHAYSWQECGGKKKILWEKSNHKVTMKLNTVSFPEGGSFRASAVKSMQKWNDVPANIELVPISKTASSVSTSDSDNDVFFSSSLFSQDDSTLGITLSRWDCSYIDYGFGRHWGDVNMNSADVYFNTNYSWTTQTSNELKTAITPYWSNGKKVFNFESVAIHEFGHALGFNHENRIFSNMNSHYPNGGPQGRVQGVHMEDTQGLIYLYGTAGQRLDVASFGVSVTNNSSNQSVDTPLNSFSTAYVAPGGSLKMRFGVQNTGNVPASNVQVHWYLSTNNYVSTGDIKLPAYTSYSTLSTWGQHEVTNTIPSNLATGTYYLGFIVDPYNTITEADENNNSMVVRKVVVAIASNDDDDDDD